MDESLYEKLIAAFRIEAEERLDALSAGLLEVEQVSDAVIREPVLEKICREAHSLKSAARAVNMEGVEKGCHCLENVLALMKSGALEPSAEMLDVLHKAVDALKEITLSSDADLGLEDALTRELERLAAGSAEGVSGTTGDIPEEGGDSLHDSMVSATSIQGQPEETAATPKGASMSHANRSVVSETVRVPTSKLDSLFYQTEELLALKLSAGQRTAELQEMRDLLGSWNVEWDKTEREAREFERSLKSGKGSTRAGDVDSQYGRLPKLIETNRQHFDDLQARVNAASSASDRDLQTLNSMIDGLLEETKSLLMLPVSLLLDLLPRMVRDIAREEGKDVELAMNGSEIAIDKRILEEMKDPLVHLVRNSVGHGIEKPSEREEKGKKPQGKIIVSVSQTDSNNIEILVSDDGAGIDVASVKQGAVQSGHLEPGDTGGISDDEALLAIFETGVSTSPIITELSGRGLGLAIVREKVEKIGGVVTVETEPGVGTTFRMVIPLALSRFRGVLVRCADRQFVFPIANVERVVRIAREEIGTVEGLDTTSLYGRRISLVRLDDVLQIAVRGPTDNGQETCTVVILRTLDTVMGFIVDEVLNEQEVLVKGLGAHLSRVRNIEGATLLGSGDLVPILNNADLMKSAIKTVAGPRVVDSGGVVKREREKRTLLVVEDSITSRMLLKNILESAGYAVITAVDGKDALTMLATESVDLVVSDVDMPRMDGLELTASIRRNDTAARMPVVLVTGMESREDREKGLEAGADAYIVKSSFDHSNLLEVISRLI